MNVTRTRITRVEQQKIGNQTVAKISIDPHWRHYAPKEFQAAGYTFPVDQDDPEALEAFAEDLELVIKRAKSKAQSIRKDQAAKLPPPSLGRQAFAIGGSAVAGGAVAYGIAAAAQQAGKIAQSSGNPYWSAFAVACGIAGAGLGAGAAGGLFYIRRDKDGWGGQLGRSLS